MLKNQFAPSQYLKVIGIVRSLVKYSLREWAGDGLSWNDVLKYLKSEEFQMQIIELLGGFANEDEAAARPAHSPFDIASTALKAADQIVQAYKIRLAPPEAAA